MGNITELLTPRQIKVENQGERKAKVVLEPFERGFGHTLGNSLRRILLSSMPGCAVVEVEIDGVLHEYTTIENVQEDVIDILHNLKGLAIKLEDKDEATLILQKKGEGVVTAADIEEQAGVEIVNLDHHIATLTKKGSLSMRLTVRNGRGYETAASRKDSDDESLSIGRLQLDASFSPVNRVSYVVDSARVEQRTNLDKFQKLRCFSHEKCFLQI